MISLQHYRISIGSFLSKTCSHREAKYDNKYKKNRSYVFVFLLSLLIMNLLVTTYVHSNTGHISHKQHNKLVQIQNGNRNSKGYRLSQWNCGSAYLEN